ncbi:hypothetical protein PORY_000685 [Pneumocystis oryctolagi]|uniref:Uncharacterized protein n=1 Tax=Pneumocystis oryctolagi TaxID=42067 RepID=A0ACB7CEG7_9ASCO|nr:hypothetical protein PORY_000685 [Pneumocystis oryctolagi]
MDFRIGSSSLPFYIERSCSPGLDGPNLAYNLDVVDWINQKKGNTAREAAMIIVHKVNDRGPLVPMLALSLLDVCVKNCGYRFHLQVSTKEFLNKLVRRFPERPPCRLSRIQIRILQTIAEWNQTLCLTSRYKEDLMNIRDMHQLLLFKGYMFPEIQHDSASVLNTPDVRSVEELEKEDRETQSAKLQELVRRGTPADLVEANKLMKILAGYDTGMKNNYRAKIAEDIEKIRRKTLLLQEMFKTSTKDAIYKSDIYEDLIFSIKDAQPKIQKILEQEKDDTNAISKLLELNDMINNTILQYEKVFRKKKVDAEESSVDTSNESSVKNDVSLISFEDEPNLEKQPCHEKYGKSDLNDLLGLSFDDNFANVSHKVNKKTQSDAKFVSLMDESLSNFDNDKLDVVPKSQTNQSFDSSFDLQCDTHYTNVKFNSMFDHISDVDSDEQKIVNISVLDSPDLVIHFFITRKNNMSNSSIMIRAEFSNKSFTDTISSLDFKMAVPSTILLKMEPQRGMVIKPSQRNGITQLVTIFGAKSVTDDLKLKWKALYYLGNNLMERSGSIDYIPSI